MKIGWKIGKKIALAALCCLTLWGMGTWAVVNAPHGAAAEAGAQAESPRLSLVATVFPAYDFARQLAGDTAEVRLLLPPGSESHSYEPTPQDIIAIQNADLFLYVGGESDSWVESMLGSMEGGGPKVFRLMDCVTAVEEELASSMEPEHAEQADQEQSAEQADQEQGAKQATQTQSAEQAVQAQNAEPQAHGAELDEHVWTSPKNAMLIVQKLADALSALQPESAEAYSQRLTAYLQELSKLDAAFTETVKNGHRDLLVFGDRFPLRYFADAYGLRYDAAFPGCSEDSEPSARTVMSLVEEVRTEGIPVIFYIEFSSRKTADIIAEETGAKELLFHSCHNVSAEELANGATYLSLMWQNVAALEEALA